VAHPPPALTPEPGERGLATTRPAEIAAASLLAWDLLVAAGEQADLTLPARAHGWTGVQVLLPFGDWPENRGMAQILADARAGVTGTVDQADDVKRVHAARSQTPPHEALDAVRRNRDSLADWIAAGGPAAEGLLPTRSLLGTLPVLTLVHATAFQIGVSARDLEACGASPSPEAWQTGLLALVDTTGALAARQGAVASLSVRTPEQLLATGSSGEAWRTVALGADEEVGGPGIVATAATVLDIASGRASVPALYSSGQLRVVDLPGLLPLAPIIEGVPGIPAGPALARAAKLLGGFGGLIGGLFRRP